MGHPQPRTVELASSILEHTTIIENFLQENGLPSPSFDPGSPPKLPLSPEVEKSLETALSSLDELMALLMGPMGWLMSQMGHAFDLASLHAMYRFKIPSQFPVGSEISITELSKRCLSDSGNETLSSDSEDNLTRLMQHAVSNYLLLRKSPGGPVSHTALSSMIAQVPGLNDWIGAACEDMWPSAPHVVHAIAHNNIPNDDDKVKSSSEPSSSSSGTFKVTGHNLAERTSVQFFDTLRSQPERKSRFANAMSVMQNMMPGFAPTAALEAYNWAGLVSPSSPSSKLTVVDIGGGQNGDFAHALAAKYGDILDKVFVQDLLESKAESHSSSGGDGGIVEFMHHDFFTPQPILGADVYFLRMVLHDWSDENCVKILRHLVPALENGENGEKSAKKGRILINDLVIPGPPPVAADDARASPNGPPGGPPSRYMEREMRRQDVAMMAMFDSKERDQEQWSTLVKLADERFKVASVTRLAGGLSPMAVIEVVFDEE